jgi:hypothetical protein
MTLNTACHCGAVSESPRRSCPQRAPRVICVRSDDIARHCSMGVCISPRDGVIEGATQTYNRADPPNPNSDAALLRDLPLLDPLVGDRGADRADGRRG